MCGRRRNCTAFLASFSTTKRFNPNDFYFAPRANKCHLAWNSFVFYNKPLPKAIRSRQATESFPEFDTSSIIVAVLEYLYINSDDGLLETHIQYIAQLLRLQKIDCENTRKNIKSENYIKMPSIEDAMKASLRRGVAEILKRDVSSTISSTESTFSSWDNCMAASYCK